MTTTTPDLTAAPRAERPALAFDKARPACESFAFLQESRAPGREAWGRCPESLIHTVLVNGCMDVDPDAISKCAYAQALTLKYLQRALERLVEGNPDEIDTKPVVENLISRFLAEFDVFLLTASRPVATELYPAGHSLQTTLLAIALGAVLGLTEDELTDLGTGCLLHDVGMLRLSDRSFAAETKLNSVAFLEITKHPTLTFDTVKDLPFVTKDASLVAYQIHERCDGSGYPRKRIAKQIHYLSKIAAICDAYVAMISPRFHRDGFLPYDALQHVISLGRTGKFDLKIVTGLLFTLSLFPVSSYVSLSDGRVARVLRSNGSRITAPVVKAWSPGENSENGEVIDLSQREDLEILEPIPKPEA